MRTLRRFAGRLLHAGAASPVGRRLLASVIFHDPSLALRPMRMATATRARFAYVPRWPSSLDAFEDLAFLFTSSPLNMGIVSMTFAEAAYLFRIVRSLGAATIVEIGRFQGGSTTIIATAMAPGSTLYSYDTHLRRTETYTGADMDRALLETLRRYGRDVGVRLLLEDSASAALVGPCDLIFVDGDHTYSGVRTDYEHWRDALRPGGHLLFHDAAFDGILSTGEGDSVRLVAEIERDDGRWFERREGADSLVHFVRTPAPRPPGPSAPADAGPSR